MHPVGVGGMFGKALLPSGTLCSVYTLIAFVFWGRGLGSRGISAEELRN